MWDVSTPHFQLGEDLQVIMKVFFLPLLFFCSLDLPNKEPPSLPEWKRVVWLNRWAGLPTGCVCVKTERESKQVK